MQTVSFILKNSTHKLSRTCLYEVFGGRVHTRIGPELSFQELQLVQEQGYLCPGGERWTAHEVKVQ